MEWSQREAVIAAIKSKAQRPYLVAIDGGGGAGKSVTARALASDLPEAIIVEVDDFYSPKNEEAFWKMSPQEGFEKNFDWERLRDQVLQPVSDGREAKYQKYDWPSGQMGEWGRIPPQSLVIVEGCFTLRSELRDYFHFKIWIEATAQQRFKRMVDRGHGNERFIPAWMAAEDWYVRNFDPMLVADVVITTDEEVA